MKYLSAALLARMSLEDRGMGAMPIDPSAIKSILSSIGAGCDEGIAKLVCNRIGKLSVNELTALGADLVGFQPECGAATAPSSAVASSSLSNVPAAPVEEEKKVESEDSDEDGMGFDLTMIYLASYCLARQSSDQSSSKDIEKIVKAAGAEFDSSMAATIVERLNGHDLVDLINQGKEMMSKVGGAAVPSQTASSAVAAPTESNTTPADAPQDQEEDSDEEMGFNLFD
ncbi:hypothetical protein ACOME3_007391 [Neoechinorhynchus agilis]